MSIEIAPAALLPLALVLGLLIGSFLNVVIHRVPAGLSIVHPPSHCPRCESKIAPWDNVPVLSYLLLRGRCRRCGVPISLRYPAVELVTGLVFLAIAWRFGASLWTIVFCLFAAALIAAAMIDADHQIIPDEISLGGLVTALLLVPIVQWRSGGDYLGALVRSGIGAIVGAGVLWGVAFLHARVAVAMGRRFEHWPGEGVALPRPSEADYWLWFPGLGLGDVKLLAMIGAVLGPIGVLDSILASSLVGLVLGGLQAVLRGGVGFPFGFAPAIAVGAIVTLFLPQLWLLRIFG
ncbi:MAG: prepilin peptidase [Deltaproteobacteria bacterium]|nr:prepilin peptidase [Deltaproteobacteria bacterium]